ncbi:MAG: ATP-dependent DNA helicase [Candidatus Nanopelagicales bacterium]|nr:ATP-dependent DNA helicase [Candidatus Nanopelagicales bacterium]MDZ4248838.1 ATP-dependent DNA helicase [Candidatus Nanopelagicales bacterium]
MSEAVRRRQMSAMRPADLPGLVGIPLSDEQIAAATAPIRPQLIVAGAGSGKTTVMAARVVWLVATGSVRPDEVLGLTFTNKAASELRSRVRLGLRRFPGNDAEPGDPTVLTYNAFAGRLLSEYGLLLGLDSGERLIGDAHRSRLAYSVACGPEVPERDVPNVRVLPTNLAERILKMDDALADLDISTDALRHWDRDLVASLDQGLNATSDKMIGAASGRIALSYIVDQFRQAKSKRDVIDFSDQVRLSAQLAQTVPAVPASMRNRFRVVLLDEYQDTSRVQRRTMQALFGGGHAVTAVGDPCQAIYGWRGASVTNIDQFAEQFPAVEGDRADVYPLSVNRRSSHAVVNLANRISTDLRAFHRDVPTLRPRGDAGPGRLSCALLRTYDDELAWVADRVAEAGRAQRWSDFAVLCRTNDDVSAIAESLRRLDVPVQLPVLRNLLDSPEVVEVTTLLRLLVDPTANPAVLYHLVGPRWRIGPRDLAILGRRAADLARSAQPDQRSAPVEISLLDAVCDPGDAASYKFSQEAKDRFWEFKQLIDDLKTWRHRSVAEVIQAVADRLALALEWEAGGASGLAARQSLDGLLDLASDFVDLSGGRGLPAFITYLDDCRRFDVQPQSQTLAMDADAVIAMTVHSSKGLEFPTVILPFLSGGVFPSSQGRKRWPTTSLALPPVCADEPDPAHDAEFPDDPVTRKRHDEYVKACKTEDLRDEDRLAYVAVTRAKERLIASGHWFGPTQKRPRGPSPYLLAVRAECAPEEILEWAAEPDSPGGPSGHGQPVAEEGRADDCWPPPLAKSDAWAAALLVEQAVASLRSNASEPTEPHAEGIPVQALSMRVAELIADATAGTDVGNGPGLLSASQVVGSIRDPKFRRRLVRPMPRRPSQSARLGTEFHEWVQKRFGQQALFDLCELPEVPDLPDDVRALAKAFEATEFADRVPEGVEVPFAVPLGDLVVVGRIDAVFPVPPGSGADVDWEVIDWKTGDPRHADPLQLAIYRYALSLSKEVPLDRISGAFVFLPAGRVERPERLPGPEQIIEQLAGGRAPASEIPTWACETRER